MTRTEGNSFLGLKVINLSDNTQVNSGGNTNVQTLQPPEGLIYKVIHLQYSASDPAGSTTGTHSFYVFYDATDITDLDGDIFLIRLSGNTGTNILINYDELTGDYETPGSDQESKTFFAGRTLNASNSIPLDFKYYNNTDANQTATRQLNMIVEVYKEVL